MSLHKPSGLRRIPRHGGDHPRNIGNSNPHSNESWKSKLTPREQIENEIAGFRQRLWDIERIQRDEHDQDRKPLNARIKRTWHQGNRRKIRQVLDLIKRFSGDTSQFISELQELERRGLGGNILTGKI